MAYTKIEAGEDTFLEFQLYDADGEAISIDDLVALVIYMICNANESVLYKFNKAGGTGYTALTKDTVYLYNTWIESGVTKDLVGKYRFEVLMTETETDLSDNELNTIGLTDADGNKLGIEFVNNQVKDEL